MVSVAVADNARQSAQEILAKTGIKGGVIVHLGCGDGKLTAALQATDSFLVHGLDSDVKNIDAARKHIQSLGKYGRISIEQHTGDRLPYIDNSVNLIVAEDLGTVSRPEVMRALVPNGVVCIKSDGEWTKATVKPWPKEIDQWTHYLHDPSNNAVAHDSVIAPPSRYQWLGGPRYSRQHDHMSSVSAVVSAAGRLFYIFDESPRASVLTPPKWKLIARDAFNGTLLWKRDIDTWHPHLWRLKSGPQMLARRLVAVSREDGKKLAAYRLDFVPRFDGLIAANGRLYITTRGGEVVCLGSDGEQSLAVAEDVVVARRE